MKTVFDKQVRDELTGRIESLNENNTPSWGKMNMYQMLKHCILAEEMYLGKKTYKREFLGRILGRLALWGLMKDEKPMGRNAPTSDHFIVKESTGDIAAEKTKWIALISDYAHYNTPEFVHWFFGKMTKEQIGYLVYKHADHHLRQFGG